MPAEFCPVCIKVYEPIMKLGEERCPACWDRAVEKAIRNNPNDFTGVLIEPAAQKFYAERLQGKEG